MVNYPHGIHANCFSFPTPSAAVLDLIYRRTQREPRIQYEYLVNVFRFFFFNLVFPNRRSALNPIYVIRIFFFFRQSILSESFRHRRDLHSLNSITNSSSILPRSFSSHISLDRPRNISSVGLQFITAPCVYIISFFVTLIRSSRPSQ